jgi:hypothetical protein
MRSPDEYGDDSAMLPRIGGQDSNASLNAAKTESVALVGRPPHRAVVANVEPALAPGAKVAGSELAGQAFGSLTIVAD